MHNLDLLADLPPPSDDEPPSLRSDIVDELLDHLQCAFRREVLKDGDEAAAERRVLDRFGDPKKLARRLWWQAMWSRIMGTRILSGLQWLVSLAAVGLAGGVFWQQSQLLKEMNANQQAELNWRQNLSLTLNDLRSRLPAAAIIAEEPAAGGGGAGAMSPMMGAGAAGPGMTTSPTLTVKLVQGMADGPPVTEALKEISLISPSNTLLNGVPQRFPDMGGMGGGMLPIISMNGCFTFDGLEPDRYELKITLADGQSSTQPVLIRDDTPQTMTVVCPAPRKKVPLLVTMKTVPEDIRAAFSVILSFWEAPQTVGGVEWKSLTSLGYELHFDAATGLPTMLERPGRRNPGAGEADFDNLAEKDRLVFPLSGPIGGRFLLRHLPSFDDRLARGKSAFQGMKGGRFPGMRMKGDRFQPLQSNEFTRELTASETHWELELPADLVALARNETAGSETSSSSEESSKGTLPAGLPSASGRSTKARKGKSFIADEEIENLPHQLKVKLVRDTENGPFVEDAELTLRRVERPIIKPRVVNVQQKTYGFVNVPPARYGLLIQLPDGQHCTKSVVIHDEKPREMTIVCPRPRPKASVLITAPPLPEHLRAAGGLLSYDVQVKPVVLEGTSWLPADAGTHSLWFDASTGKVAKISMNNEIVDVTNADEADRAILLPTGPVRGHFSIKGIPLRPTDDNPQSYYHQADIDRNVAPGENHWELELPDKLIAAFQEFLKSGSGRGKMFRRVIDPQTGKAIGVPVETPDENKPATAEQPENDSQQPKDNPPGDSPAAKTETDENRTDDPSVSAKLPADKCRVFVKFVSETGDGSPPEGMKVSLLTKDAAASDETDTVAVQAGRAGKKMKGVLRGSLFISDQIPPGRYELVAKFPDGRFLKFDLPELKGGQQRYEEVVCPPPVKLVTVKIAAPPMPEEFHSHRISLSSWLKPVPIQLKGREWTIQQEIEGLSFDWKTGALQSEDGEIALAEGTYGLLLFWKTYLIEKTPHGETVTPIPLAEWPGADKESVSRFTTQPGENTWEIKVPDDFWDEARKKLAAGFDPGEPLGAEEPATPKDNPPGDSPGAKTESDDSADAEPIDNPPPGDEPEENAAIDPGLGQLRIQVVRDTDDRPVKDAEVTLMDRDDGCTVLHHAVTDETGNATLRQLNSDNYHLWIVSRRTGFYAVQELTVRAGEQMTKLVKLPSNLASCQLKLTTNLPDDLADQGVRVCVMLRGFMGSFVGSNLLKWNAGLGGATWSEPLILGPKGCEGRLSGKEVWQPTDFMPRTIAAQLLPVTQTSEGLVCPIVRQQLLGMALVRSTRGQLKDQQGLREDAKSEWQVCAASDYVDGKMPAYLNQHFTPSKDELNQWHIEIPDELLAAAREKLAKETSARALRSEASRRG